MRKAEIEYAAKEEERKKEKEIQKRVDQYIAYLEDRMKQAAETGKFSVEEEVSGCDEVKRRLEVAFSQFKPKWHSDGYTKDYINLSW